METWGGILGGLGALGLLLAILIGAAVLVFLPWWAIVDHLAARSSGTAKVVGLVALVVTWGVGSIFYGLFLARAQALRVFTGIVVACLGILFVFSLVTLGTGAGLHARHLAEERARERAEVDAAFQPAPIPATAIGAFHTLHFTYAGYGPATAALARFTLSGPDVESARDVDHNVRHVAYDAAHDRCFALRGHEFGTLSPTDGRFTRIAIDSTLGNFSWPAGIAFDSTTGLVYLASSSGATRFLTYDPRTSRWKLLPTEVPDLPLIALAMLPSDGCLYGLEARSSDPALRRIHRFNRAGASLGAIELHPAIPFPSRVEAVAQLAPAGGRLVLVLPPNTGEGPATIGAGAANRILVVDPASGQVLRPIATR